MRETDSVESYPEHNKGMYGENPTLKECTLFTTYLKVCGHFSSACLMHEWDISL